MYDHCAHYIRDARIIVIYGGRNHKLFNLRGGKTAFSDVHILNLTYLVWCKVKTNAGPSLERYLFNSFLWDHKLYVFGGLNDKNFAGCNVNRLELLEEEAKFIKGFKDDQEVNFEGYMKSMNKKKQLKEKKTDFNDILAMINNKQSQDDIKVKNFHEKYSKKYTGVMDATQAEEPRSATHRGFVPFPDPFLDLINNRLSKKNLSIAKF